MHRSTKSKVGGAPVGVHPLIQPFPAAKELAAPSSVGELSSGHPLIAPFPPAKEVAASSSVRKYPSDIHPLIEPFPPAKEDAGDAARHGMEYPQGHQYHSRTQSAVSNFSSMSSQSVKPGLGTKAGMNSIAHMPPCSECGNKEHQRTHCFYAHPSNLRKYLEDFPARTQVWKERVAAHKAKIEKKKKEEAGTCSPRSRIRVD